MKAGTIKYEATGDLLISFQTAGPIPEPMWADFIKCLNTPAIRKYVATTIGAVEANSVQRKLATDVFKARKIPVVVVTESGLVRGLATAASWLGADVKSCDWPEVRKGLEHLGVTGTQQERAVVIIQQLKANYAR